MVGPRYASTVGVLTVARGSVRIRTRRTHPLTPDPGLKGCVNFCSCCYFCSVLGTQLFCKRGAPSLCTGAADTRRVQIIRIICKKVAAKVCTPQNE